MTNIRSMFAKDTHERSVVDIDDVIRSVLTILRHDLQKNGVEVQAQLSDQLPAVKGNKVQLQQVILNLVKQLVIVFFFFFCLCVPRSSILFLRFRPRQSTGVGQ